MKKTDSSTPSLKRILIICIACTTLLASGCSFFGEGGGSEPETQDVCEGVFHSFITQHDNGLGITSDECVDSARGEWLDGRCYCHGVDE